jgi:hypothetical protein
LMVRTLFGRSSHSANKKMFVHLSLELTFRTISDKFVFAKRNLSHNILTYLTGRFTLKPILCNCDKELCNPETNWCYNWLIISMFEFSRMYFHGFLYTNSTLQLLRLEQSTISPSALLLDVGYVRRYQKPQNKRSCSYIVHWSSKLQTGAISLDFGKETNIWMLGSQDP